MILLVLGLAILAMKFAGYGPVADWPWWVFPIPFVATLLWWWYADVSGLNKRREMDRMEDRKSERRYGLLQRMGLSGRVRGRSRSSKKADRAHAARQYQIDKIEGKRAEQRAKHRDSVLRSRFDAEASITRPSQINGSKAASAAHAKASRASMTAGPRQAPSVDAGGSYAGPNKAVDFESGSYAGFSETVPVDPVAKKEK
jgi:small Trp-rich protein